MVHTLQSKNGKEKNMEKSKIEILQFTIPFNKNLILHIQDGENVVGWAHVFVNIYPNARGKFLNTNIKYYITWNMFNPISENDQKLIWWKLKNYIRIAYNNIRTSFDDAIKQNELEPSVFGEDKYRIFAERG